MNPILPSNAVRMAKNNRVFPDFVIDAFNELIVKNMRGTTSVVKQDEVMELIIEKTKGQFERQEIFTEKWLDIEDHFRNFGWKVEFDRPAYCESYNAFFTFKA